MQVSLAVQFKLCPVCDGTGSKDIASKLPKKRKEFACDNCQGQSYVPLLTCRGCGRAAIEWEAAVPYCGREDCWKKLVEVIDPNAPAPRSNIIPFGPARGNYLSGGFSVVDNRRRFHNDTGQIWDPFKKEYVDSIDLQNRAGGLTPEDEANIARAMSFGWCDLGLGEC